MYRVYKTFNGLAFEPSLTCETLLKELNVDQVIPNNKVTIIGCGQVATACAFSILIQEFASELSLIGADLNKLQGELLDLQDGLVFIESCSIKTSQDYLISQGSKICVISTDAKEELDESQFSLMQRNIEMLKGIIPNLVKHSPDTILLVVANPVNPLTYAAWKLSGLPKERVFGTGTSLDSAKFRFILSERLNVSADCCDGWVIGEPGKSSVVASSTVSVGGVAVELGCEDENANYQRIHELANESDDEVKKLKGSASWALSLCVASMCRAVLTNSREVFSLSVNVNGLYGIDSDVYLSLPCVLEENGVTDIIRLYLTPDEEEQMQQSAKRMLDIQSELDGYL